MGKGEREGKGKGESCGEVDGGEKRRENEDKRGNGSGENIHFLVDELSP